MDYNNTFAVIMAGGRGERFWPQSRQSNPKQLLKLISDVTLIEQTVNRLDGFVPKKNIFIITNDAYVAAMRTLLKELPADNIIGEPIGRDTAPCVALAAGVVKAKAKNDDAVMFLLPADHVINNSDAMIDVMNDCVAFAEHDKVVTIGIPPTEASTAYGYICCGDEIANGTKTKFYDSKGFREKPDQATAEKFLKSGNYEWNSGMFCWSVKTICAAFEQHCPEIFSAISKFETAFSNHQINECLKHIYPTFEKISIDYAIMEKIDNIVVAESLFDWDDVGSWTALRNQLPADESNNVVRGTHVGIDSTNNIIVGKPNHVITTIDVDDLIIVQTDDATLVCKAESAQRIKEAIKLMQADPEMESHL